MWPTVAGCRFVAKPIGAQVSVSLAASLVGAPGKCLAALAAPQAAAPAVLHAACCRRLPRRWDIVAAAASSLPPLIAADTATILSGKVLRSSLFVKKPSILLLCAPCGPALCNRGAAHGRRMGWAQCCMDPSLPCRRGNTTFVGLSNKADHAGCMQARLRGKPAWLQDARHRWAAATARAVAGGRRHLILSLTGMHAWLLGGQFGSCTTRVANGNELVAPAARSPAGRAPLAWRRPCLGSGSNPHLPWAVHNPMTERGLLCERKCTEHGHVPTSELPGGLRSQARCTVVFDHVN